MFVLFSGTVVTAARQPDRSALLSQRRRKDLVDRDSAEGSDVGVAVVNGGEGERLVVRGRDDHYAVKLAILEHCVAVACNGSGERVSGVRSNQRNEWFLDGWNLGFSQKSIHHLAQFVGIGRIEGPRYPPCRTFSCEVPATLAANRNATIIAMNMLFCRIITFNSTPRGSDAGTSGTY